LTFFQVVTVNADNLNVIIELTVLLLLFISSAALSASEVSYFSLKPDEVRSLKALGKTNSKTAVRLHDNPEKLLSTILVAKNTLNILFIFLSAIVSVRLAYSQSGNLPVFIIIMAVITFTLLLAGEILPKLYASRKRVPVVLTTAPFLNVLQAILNPVTSLISIYPFLFLRKKFESANYQTAADNGGADPTTISEDEIILRGIANFGNTNVSAIMVPRWSWAGAPISIPKKTTSCGFRPAISGKSWRSTLRPRARMNQLSSRFRKAPTFRSSEPGLRRRWHRRAGRSRSAIDLGSVSS
jgi:CBS domain containing-hemolysin-like protein